MKKLIQFVIVCFFLLIDMNQNLVYAARDVGHSKPIKGNLATYELYYHYSEEDEAYRNQHRLTLSAYDFQKINDKFKWDKEKSLEENVEKYMQDHNVMHEITDIFPRLSPYFNEIKYQFACHDIGKLLGKNQNEWDMEIQRKIPLFGFFDEININIPYVLNKKGKECNNADWTDNKLLFYPGVKFHGQLPYPNEWISYQKNESPVYYYVDENYVGVTGWKYVDAWYYFNDFAVMQTGWVDYNNQWYYLDTNGRMQSGIQKINEKYYAFKRDTGEMYHSKWIGDNGKWYYSKDSNGDLSINKWEEIDNKWYYFNHDATMKTGWLDYNDHWYYLEDTGAMVTGWQDIGGSRYYFKTNGEMVTGVHIIGGVEYEFHSSGHLIQTRKKDISNSCDKYSCMMPYSNNKKGVSR